MTLLSRAELTSITETAAQPRVSIYLPTHRKAAETAKDRIRLGNRLRDVQEQLISMGWRNDAKLRELLRPARELEADDFFWQHQSDGLAMFLSPSGTHSFRLPLRFEELSVVGERFHVKPVLPLLNGDGRFHVLAISQNSVRLFEGSRDSVREIDLVDIPENLRDAVGYDWAERSLQFHSSSGASSGGMRAAVFHGQGAPKDDAKDEIARYLRMVDHGVVHLLTDRNTPLVVAAVDYLIGIYQEITRYPDVLAFGIPGNPEGLSADRVHDAAWKLVEPRFLESQRRFAGRYRELAGTGKASSNLSEIVPAAHDGRVAQLFVAVDRHSWGRFDEQSREVQELRARAPGADDLLDLAAHHTLRGNGTIFAVPHDQVPGGDVAAAIYRF